MVILYLGAWTFIVGCAIHQQPMRSAFTVNVRMDLVYLMTFQSEHKDAEIAKVPLPHRQGL